MRSARSWDPTSALGPHPFTPPYDDTWQVGKIAHEALDKFAEALSGVERPPIDEADVLEYFDHAIALRRAIQFLRSHASCAINGTMGPHHPDPWDPMLSRVW